MPITVDCGEGKHAICRGAGSVAYLIPQDSPGPGEADFTCGCVCHHPREPANLTGAAIAGTGVPCSSCYPDGPASHRIVITGNQGGIICTCEPCGAVFTCDHEAQANAWRDGHLRGTEADRG